MKVDMALNIRYEGEKVWNMYISPENNFYAEEFVKNMNEKIAELKEWADKNLDSDNFNDEFFEKIKSPAGQISGAYIGGNF